MRINRLLEGLFSPPAKIFLTVVHVYDDFLSQQRKKPLSQGDFSVILAVSIKHHETKRVSISETQFNQLMESMFSPAVNFAVMGCVAY